MNNYKILVIEDTADVRENIAEILESENYEVYKAENGIIGVDVAEKVQPDLILCDIMMPQMDGYEVLESLRKKVSTSTTPFIFLTAKNTREDLRRGMALGADDYISKPFTIDELLNSIKIRLEKAEEFKVKSERKLNELTQNLGMPITSVINEPLKAIIGFSRMVMTEYPNMEKPEIAEFMALVYKAGMKLNKVVHKTMLYYRLEALTYRNEELDKCRAEVCYNAGTALKEVVQELALAHNRIDDVLVLLDTIENVRIPKDMLKSLIGELIENALLYSPKRTNIKVISGIERGKLVLTISDEGIGFSSEQITKIGAFTQFSQDFNKQEGIGLGLTVVRKILTLFDGQITINSAPGVGTTIKVFIPTVA
jgi:CheY-like chemotaxis protein/anti-sigma regulatory factor (Ser/Thr protein kinase)